VAGLHDLTEGEATAEGERVEVNVLGALRRVYSAEGFWFALVEIPSNSGGWQRICVPLRQVKLLVPQPAGS
jgi:hypothetical protein